MVEGQNANTNNTQSGRSMVEMLGVLAIIGVLSISGISGYKMAMDNNKVNCIINGVSERAVVLSQKAIAGTVLSISEEFGTTILGYDVALGKKYENSFRLTVSGIEKDICEKTLDTGLNSAFQISTSENVVWKQGKKIEGIRCKDSGNSLIYDFDVILEQKAVAVEPPTPGSECTESCIATNGTATCVNGYCQCELGLWQPSDDSGSGTCKETITKGNCIKNSDCIGQTVDNKACTTSTCYCAVTSSASSNQCETPTTGTCTAVGISKPKTYNGKKFFMSPYSTMTWWSAHNWCLAQGKSLVSLSDTGCTTSDCSNWSNLSMTMGAASWMTNNNKNSCVAYGVFSNSRLVGGGYRYKLYYALCK